MKYKILKHYPHFVSLHGFFLGLRIELSITNYFNPRWDLFTEEGILIKEFENYNELNNYCRDYELEIQL